ncbi:MAG: HAMP domain-containing histidine kinase [Oscillospiraceae bacterium]|nr:HAMP domain-containing histidine kinase [Oscillospiraceae bacterium]MCI9549291.1 HAMP domain-containing histidine kinase [Oscillospiraceae bacterium]
MKLFWKLFCSMVSVTLLACAVGGFVLIDGQFRAALDQEVQALYVENDMLRFVLARELEGRSVSRREELSRLTGSMLLSSGGRTAAFRLSGGDGTVLGGTGLPYLERGALTGALAEDRRGWRLVRVPEGAALLHGASALSLGDEILWLENCRDVSALFVQRDGQYRSFSLVMLALTAGVGLLSLLVSHVILRPLERLSAATRKMAEGELAQRVAVTSGDELGQLSEDFNAMAGRLEEQVAQLTAAARRERDFTAAFAHEIKTPLTSIIGYADLLLSRENTPDQVRDSAGYIFREGRRLEALSGKLMELIVLDRRDFPLRPVSLRAFLERTGNALRPALEGASLRFRVDAEETPVFLEPDLMETVCLNLLDNARKATPPGGSVTLAGRGTEDGGCVIQVTDTGKGIPEEELGRIAEPFYMVDKSRARAQGGAGLGLALCKRIAELHGGTLNVHSAPGAGSTAEVRLKGGGEA